MGIVLNPLNIPGLEHGRVEMNGIWLHYVRGGTNEDQPLILLHGFPESWVMWRDLLPDLMAKHHVIAVDLRGYGDSAKPNGEEGYDKGTMAADIEILCRHLRVAPPVIIGHDRGGRVARRYALDRPRQVKGVALLDILPMEYIYDRLSAAEVSERYWHWVFHLVADLPEILIAGKEEEYLARFLSRPAGLLERLKADGSWLEYRRCWLQPGAVQAALNDYRATYRQDVPFYRAANKAGKKLTVPTLVLWGNRGNLSNQPVVDIWRQVATNVRGHVLGGCGHFLAEEQPEIVARELLKFAADCFAEE